jgi:hypothetical protein
LRDDFSDSSRQLNNLIVEATPDQRQYIIRELEDELLQSLQGFTINKNKYTHLNNIDPKEMIEISNTIKKELDSNDKFYLHGEYLI